MNPLDSDVKAEESQQQAPATARKATVDDGREQVVTQPTTQMEVERPY